MSYEINKQGLPCIDKAKASRLDYSFDWSDWLADQGDEISTYEINCGWLSKISDARDGAVITVLLDDGIPGYEYPVTCSIVTVDGREDSRTIVINVVSDR